MADVARRRRRAAPVKLPSSTTVSSTESWSTLGVPGACISNLLKRTFKFIRVFRVRRVSMFGARLQPALSEEEHAEGGIDRRKHASEPVRRHTGAVAGRGGVSAA